MDRFYDLVEHNGIGIHHTEHKRVFNKNELWGLGTTTLVDIVKKNSKNMCSVKSIVFTFFCTASAKGPIKKK